jgi:hypothetical protein
VRAVVFDAREGRLVPEFKRFRTEDGCVWKGDDGDVGDGGDALLKGPPYTKSTEIGAMEVYQVCFA